MRVEWTYEGHVPTVSVNLLKDSRIPALECLKRSVVNTGSCTVTVPRGLLPDSDYRVEVHSGECRDVKSSSAPLCIDFGSVRPSITTTHPAGGDRLQGGASMRVEWTYEGHVPTVSVNLLKDSRILALECLKRSVVNTGSCTVTVPRGLLPDSDYRVEVHSGECRDVKSSSAPLCIDFGSVRPSITTTHPAGGDRLQGGASMRVEWTYEGHVPTVSVNLLKDSRILALECLKRSVVNTGSCTVTVPRGLLPDSDYRIEVKSKATREISGRSAPFGIDIDLTRSAPTRQQSSSGARSESVAVSRACAICNSEERLGNSTDFPVVTTACKHEASVACKDCLSEHIKHAIKNTGNLEVQCPLCMVSDPGCTTFLEYEDIKRLATKTVFARYDDLLRQRCLNQDASFQFCKNPSCTSGQFHQTQASEPIVTCVSCGAKSCFVHDAVWHEGLTCEEYDEEQRKKSHAADDQKSCELVKEITKPCPKCNAPIIKKSGCDHMTCTRCKFEFCYDCLAPHKEYIRHGNHRHKQSSRHWRSPGGTGT
ncbi:hypothetical protein CYMTET_6783 [Cymbomonas tetramitiformis]|uniref:RBR-type E3 ubiquitin transferase n=1 Tax=Cymbomonas tetramitiformis TaxID=36881 RepID=A0AAE0GWW0_9CHLO|nr:hypothetical protein CYMTET_6783 [Cymbomonas tetramitiformis]